MKKLLTTKTQYGEIRTVVSRSFWLRAPAIEKYRFRLLFNADVTPAGGAGYKAWEVVEGRQRNDFMTILICLTIPRAIFETIFVMSKSFEVHMFIPRKSNSGIFVLQMQLSML